MSGWTEADLMRQQAKFARQEDARLADRAQAVILPARMPQKARASRFDWADTLKQQIALVGLPEPLRDHLGIPGRRFKMDLAWPDLMICCEVDGGEWAQTNRQKARHGHALGMQTDCEKNNLALLAGWKPYRFTGSQVESGYALTTIETALRCTP